MKLDVVLYKHPMAAAELGSRAASSMSVCAIWYAGVCRYFFFRRLEFEFSCTHDKRVVSLFYYHSNSPLALWKRYLLSVSDMKSRGDFVKHTPSCSWSECRP